MDKTILIIFMDKIFKIKKKKIYIKIIDGMVPLHLSFSVKLLLFQCLLSFLLRFTYKLKHIKNGNRYIYFKYLQIELFFFFLI